MIQHKRLLQQLTFLVAAGSALTASARAQLGLPQLLPGDAVTSASAGSQDSPPSRAAGIACSSSGRTGAASSPAPCRTAPTSRTTTSTARCSTSSASPSARPSSVNGGAGATFGDGLRCAGTGIVRLGVRVPDTAGAASLGPGLGALGRWSSGDTRYLQTWYRDPIAVSPCGLGFNLSKGVQLTFTP